MKSKLFLISLILIACNQNDGEEVALSVHSSFEETWEKTITLNAANEVIYEGVHETESSLNVYNCFGMETLELWKGEISGYDCTYYLFDFAVNCKAKNSLVNDSCNTITVELVNSNMLVYKKDTVIRIVYVNEFNSELMEITDSSKYEVKKYLVDKQPFMCNTSYGIDSELDLLNQLRFPILSHNYHYSYSVGAKFFYRYIKKSDDFRTVQQVFLNRPCQSWNDTIDKSEPLENGLEFANILNYKKEKDRIVKVQFLTNSPNSIDTLDIYKIR